MRKKLLALSLGILFFGSITTSTFAMTVNNTTDIVFADDDDKDKTKSKSKKTATTDAKSSKGDCAAKKECCEKSCDDKKAADKKEGGDKK